MEYAPNESGHHDEGSSVEQIVDSEEFAAGLSTRKNVSGHAPFAFSITFDFKAVRNRVAR